MDVDIGDFLWQVSLDMATDRLCYPLHKLFIIHVPAVARYSWNNCLFDLDSVLKWS